MRAKNVSKEDWTKKKIGRYEIDRLVDISAVKKAKYKSCRPTQISSTMMETKSNVVSYLSFICFVPHHSIKMIAFVSSLYRKRS